ncbi:leishmanolysin family protein, putative [Ichthyophthirius multifiliis]|uniref:Leishmanolysin family protein, putative n=1 Tax=Ichthyophthirius multifiliis TaxID=5932 RepID=G0QL44_ICHMU|nr:leishmanolysin family protein, putative [Ichthyophthirius multifiliis]EGR34062.1 leishmanolysin family protein, putative [Ichthyophthirius multifiliis]|eukprot:XP_004039366.1 leishmanolysin family protein, putative [Ichthyophthirius multifiliis]
MRYRQYNPKCGEYPIPQSDRDQGIKSDLHIYTQYKIEPAETYVAYASWCQFLDVIGPTHGQVNFNLGLLGRKNMQDPVEFEDLMEIVIHEMTHILGFSDSDIPRWVDLQGRPHNNPLIKLNVRGTPTLVVRTPHVLNYARRPGCEHFMGKCYSTKREFCNPKTDDGLCYYYHHGQSSCSVRKLNDPGCNTLDTYVNSKCWAVKSNQKTQKTQVQQEVKYRIDLKCFNGNISAQQLPKMTMTIDNLYKYECDSTKIQMNI